jgi:hypothetical protein
MTVPDTPIYWGGNYYLDVDDTLCTSEVDILDCKSKKTTNYVKPESEIMFNTIEKCAKTPCSKNKGRNDEGYIGSGYIGSGYDEYDIEKVKSDKNGNVVIEGFGDASGVANSCNSCKAIKWNWIMLVLLVVMAFMFIIYWSI